MKAFLPPDTSADSSSGLQPRVITATVPTELLVSDGPFKWAPIADNNLLYVTNTESNVLKDIASQKYYLLLSGRWYSSLALAGPWQFERPDDLPASFRKIPASSPVGDVLAQVPGTEQAADALADIDVPQTAAVNRSDAKLDLSYDGAPQFQPIPGTTVEYAVNTALSVLRIGDRYYACDNAVWFVALTPTGPWVVSDSVPQAVQTIPPSSPVYNVKYVQVYQSTPDVVYVGYTPGYTGAYSYYGTVVYGTGWRYRPWIGPVYYYSRPLTWGLHAYYDPWTESGGSGSATV